MNRRFFLAATLAALAQAPFAALADIESEIVRRLRAAGYRQITVTRTMLGRLRITAVGRGGTREIILNPKTGEVLRDVFIAADGSSVPATLAEQEGGDEDSSGSGSGDDSDDDGDDDNSGSGSGGGDDKDDDKDDDSDDDSDDDGGDDDSDDDGGDDDSGGGGDDDD